MSRVTLFAARNDAGQQLVDEFVVPLCHRLGLTPVVREPTDRGVAVSAQAMSRFVLWDASVEPGHIYRAFTELAKQSSKHIVLSRTPLPRNVLARHQCAPRHGEALTNADLGAWLDNVLPALVRGEEPEPSPTPRARPALTRPSVSVERIFVSVRGSRPDEAERWADAVQAEHGLTSRIVPDGEYAYETECVTRQQMWEVVARLSYEMDATRRVAILRSHDYFDSFWTTSELLVALRYRASRSALYLVDGPDDTRLTRLRFDAQFPLPIPTGDHARRVDRILDNSDPLSAAPETRHGRGTGLAERGLAWLSNKVGSYHDPEFTTARFWDEVMVPCPTCRPRHRRAQDVDWTAHLALPSDGEALEVDAYGYFGVDAGELARGVVTCPRCHCTVGLRNDRPPRTLWVPLPSTRKEEDRPVLVDNLVWEVVPH